MLPDDFKTRVKEMFDGEVYGEELTAELAKRYSDPDRAYKMTVLAQLERETKNRLKPLARELGLSTEADPAEIARGRNDAETIAQMGWVEFMSAWIEPVEQFVARYRETEGMADPKHRKLMESVTAHEEAILSFVTLEAAGKGDESLQPILSLLERPPAGRA